MTQSSLPGLHEEIDQLATDEGEYRIIMTQTGSRPVPVEDKRFADRQAATDAAGLVQQYYAILRERDPHLPCLDFIVCESSPSSTSATSESSATGRCTPKTGETGRLLTRYAWDFTQTPPAGAPESRRALVEFCRELAGVLFRTLAARGLTELEQAIVHQYRAASESTASQDERCHAFLRSTATACNRRLTPMVQLSLLRTTSKLLSPPAQSDDPREAVLRRMASMGLVTDYSVNPREAPSTDTSREWAAVLHEWPLTTNVGVVTLPLTIECFRRSPPLAASTVGAERIGEMRWRLTFEPLSEPTPDGLMSRPIASSP